MDFALENRIQDILSLNKAETRGLEVSKVKLDQDKISKLFTTCLTSCYVLSDHSVFYYGNDWGSDKTFLNKNISEFPSGLRKNWGLNLLHHNHYVYAIGGDYSTAERFDLKHNKWRTLAKLP